MENLSGANLLKTVQHLADEIGPRPPGSEQEEEAREYLVQELQNAGINQIERIDFPTVNSWGWGLTVPVALAFFASLLSWLGGTFNYISAALSLFSAWEYWKMLNSNIEKQWLYPLYKKFPGATLLAKLPAQEKMRQKVVLIGHTDTNKNRPSFSPTGLKLLGSSTLSVLAAIVLNGIAAFFGWFWLKRITEMLLLVGLTTFVLDDTGEFVDGANDNASAVAVTLGLGKYFKDNPLKTTEVWLAFTGSEEVGLVGMNALINKYPDELRDAYFIDFELVGAGRIVYVTEHSGFSVLNGYKPDPESAQLADETAKAHPELKVYGQPVVINEEISTLRQRGYRGICLVGLDEEDKMINWHRLTDKSYAIEPEALEATARFALSMIERLDAQG